jgi:hypothetical protein
MYYIRDYDKEREIIAYWRSEIKFTAKVNVKMYPMEEATVATESKPCNSNKWKAKQRSNFL